MSDGTGKALLVGDNPFHNISHLSQERGTSRDSALTYPEHAANLVMISMENGANGFMFSVSEATLSILRVIRKREQNKSLNLFAIVPYAYEYVRLANQLGGVPGLARRFVRNIATSGNLRAAGLGLNGVLRTDPVSLMKAYLMYEISRVRSSAGKQVNISSVLLHQTITDMFLALELDGLLKAHVDCMLRLGIVPGFNTGNFVQLVNKFREWNIDLRKTVVAAPFNKAGFQMNPSREECEEALASIPSPVVIAISILAAGYLKPMEAIEYIGELPNVKGVAVGVSKEKHARQTFRLLKEKLECDHSAH